MISTVMLLALPAAAATINYTGQGTTNGACDTLIFDPNVGAGDQIWQFNLTGTQSGATMSYQFSDGTSGTDVPESQHQGNTSFWFITTDLGATVTSASATFTDAGPGNNQFTVSHCRVGDPSVTTTSTTRPDGNGNGDDDEEEPAAVPPAPVEAAATFTG